MNSFILTLYFIRIVKSESVSHSVVSNCTWPMDCSPPGFYVYGILQARILGWVAITFLRGSSQPRDRTWVSCIAGRLSTIWTTREGGVRGWVWVCVCGWVGGWGCGCVCVSVCVCVKECTMWSRKVGITHIPGKQKSVFQVTDYKDYPLPQDRQRPLWLCWSEGKWFILHHQIPYPSPSNNVSLEVSP